MFAYGYFNELRPTVGTFLRVTVDIAAIWVGFLIGWVVIHGGDTSIAAGQAGILLALAVCLSAVCFLGYTAAGLYTVSRASALQTRLGRVFLVTLGLFVIAGVIWLLASWFLGLSVGTPATTAQLFLVAFLISTVLVMLARVASLVLRTDSLDESDLDRQQPGDENKVLVVGGCGYIGSILVEKLLDQGKEVLVFDAMHFGNEPLSAVADHDNLTIIREDFRHVEALTRSMSGVGTVIHL
ncbi:MAG: NAD-dependent epimerase/dehydratase family protein, partial [Anderseniella sp.]